MSLTGNILWLLLGGFFIFLEYLVSGFALCLTIIGIPFGIQIFKLAILSLWPFGSEVVKRKEASGCLSLFMNILWIFIGGIWIFLSHLIFALILTITVIGIPFAVQHLKLATLALMPFGKDIREKN